MSLGNEIPVPANLVQNLLLCHGWSLTDLANTGTFLKLN